MKPQPPRDMGSEIKSCRDSYKDTCSSSSYSYTVIKASTSCIFRTLYSTSKRIYRWPFLTFIGWWFYVYDAIACLKERSLTVVQRNHYLSRLTGLSTTTSDKPYFPFPFRSFSKRLFRSLKISLSLSATFSVKTLGQSL